jgi:periplasmic protein TonB
MPESAARNAAPPSTLGHLSVHLEAQHPAEVAFRFERPGQRLPGALGFSSVVHVALLALAFLSFRYVPEVSVTSKVSSPPPPQISRNIVWLAEPGPGGGGGGGGNRSPLPPRKAQLPGKDKVTVPVFKPVPIQLNSREIRDTPPLPEQQLNIPAKLMASGDTTVVGVLEDIPGASDTSQGSGSGGGAGTGTGTGIGPGQGSGLGPGSGGGTGGGVYRPGSGIELPRVLREVKPQYTPDAMRAKVQGTVVLECVVMPDGSVDQVQVIRSLDPVFGLDQEAVKAAKQWRFAPGTRQGEPVPVLVTIELTFTLR